MKRKRAIVILAVMAVLIILGTVFGFVSLDDGQLGVIDYIAYPKAIKLGLDLKGGVYAVFNAEREDGMTNEEYKRSLDGTAVSLQNLLFSKGYSEAMVSVSQTDRQIRVEVPDVDDPDRIFELIGRPASLEFKRSEAGEVLMTGKDIKEAGVTYHQESGRYAVLLQFNAEGTKKFAEITQDIVNSSDKNLTIYANGEALITAEVSTAITNGQATISRSTGYSYDEAYELAVSIQAGAFALNLNVEEWETISPTLGANAIMAGVLAGLVGIVLIFVVMIWWYRMMGVAASIALCFYTMTYLFFMAIFPWVQLSLSGIAGILLSIGMAVDANVIIFERIKEERLNNKPIPSAVNIGFKKSFSAIIDGNVTTLIGAIVMWILGAATIKGFAITLFIGILISLFSSLVITRFVLKYCFLPLNDKSDKFYGLKTAAKKKA